MKGETTRNLLKKLFSQALKELDFSLKNFNISVPEAKFGDYATNAGLILGKKEKKNPKELAEKIIGKIKVLDSEGLFSEINETTGFINFRLSKNALLENLADILSSKDNYGASKKGKNQTAIVEYFQLNIAKKPHVGHMRSALIGDCLKRILKAQGYKTLSDTHVGDWGTQFGIMIAAYKKYGDPAAVERDPLEELERLYVKYNEEMESSPDLREIGKAEFAKLETGDKGNRKLWEWFNEVSMEKLHEMAKLLALEDFDMHLGESFYEGKMDAVVDELTRKGIAKTDEHGSILVYLENFKLDQAILKKSDGATTYLLRDLAKLKYIWAKYHYAKNIYIVDVRQSFHFRQLFKVAELAGWKGVRESRHVDYGFVSLPEGLMSTRKGNTVNLEKVVEEAKTRALAIIKEKNPRLKNQEEVAYQVGLSALKYFDLSHNPKSDIVFTWEKALNFEGNTGPYLQYTHARIFGILRKVNISPLPLLILRGGEGVILNVHELSVSRKLHQFPEIVEEAAEALQPNILCNYLFELSQSFNTFYQEVPVLQEEDTGKKSFRLDLITATAQVIKNGLSLLGIEAPEEM